MKGRTGFFEKINKPVARQIKKKRGKILIENEKEDITTDITEMGRIIRGYYDQLYATTR